MPMNQAKSRGNKKSKAILIEKSKSESLVSQKYLVIKGIGTANNIVRSIGLNTSLKNLCAEKPIAFRQNKNLTIPLTADMKIITINTDCAG